MKARLPKIIELDNGKVHYDVGMTGLDQVTFCGLTDWIGSKGGT